MLTVGDKFPQLKLRANVGLEDGKQFAEGAALRVTYVVDPDGIIRYVSATDLSVGRNVDEVLRVLDALQSDELCPCNWKPGEKTLGAA